MKIIAKSVNLTPREKPKKKQDKYSEISDIKKEFKFPIKSIAIYVGMTTNYRGLESTIIKQSRRKNNDYYNIEFNDGEQLDSVSSVYLRTLEEYELELDQTENKSEEDIEMSDEEIKVIENGYVPYKNRFSCFSPIDFLKKNCLNECTHRHQCIYRFKGKYDKIKFN